MSILNYCTNKMVSKLTGENLNFFRKRGERNFELTGLKAPVHRNPFKSNTALPCFHSNNAGTEKSLPTKNGHLFPTSILTQRSRRQLRLNFPAFESSIPGL